MMTIQKIIEKHYHELKAMCKNDDKVISQGRTSEDILQDVCLKALRKFKTDVEEQEGLEYLKKSLGYELHFQYNRINSPIVFTDNVPDRGYEIPD